MSFFAYILKSLKDNKFYIGQTSNMIRRFDEHNRGKVRSTKHRTPFVIIFTEEHNTRSEALKRETLFKSYKKTSDLLLHLGVNSNIP